MKLKQALDKYTLPPGILVNHEMIIAIIPEPSGRSRSVCR